MTRTLVAATIAFSIAAPAAAQTIRAGEWLRLDLHARVQTDVRRTDGSEDSSDPPVDIARRRVGVEGRAGKAVEYQLEYEIGSREWRDAFVDVRPHKALRAQIGMFKVPFGLEATTSATKLDFIDRSRISERLAPGRDQGVMLHGRLARNLLAYEAGFFRHDGDNARPKKITRSRAAGLVAGRVLVEPFRSRKGTLRSLHVGAAANSSSLALSFPGIRARTSSGASFFDSDLWVQGRRLRSGLEASWHPGRLSLQAEYIRVSDERQGQAVDDTNLPPFVARGWYASGRYRMGRLEAAVRVERIAFGDVSGNADASTSERAEIVQGAFDRATTVGVNWYINRWIKLQANAVREQLRDASFWSRVLRLQVAI